MLFFWSCQPSNDFFIIFLTKILFYYTSFFYTILVKKIFFYDIIYIVRVKYKKYGYKLRYHKKRFFWKIFRVSIPIVKATEFVKKYKGSGKNFKNIFLKSLVIFREELTKYYYKKIMI